MRAKAGSLGCRQGNGGWEAPIRSIQEEAGNFCLASTPPLNGAGERTTGTAGLDGAGLWVCPSWPCHVHGQVVLKMWACCNATQVLNAASVWWHWDGSHGSGTYGKMMSRNGECFLLSPQVRVKWLFLELQLGRQAVCKPALTCASPKGCVRWPLSLLVIYLREEMTSFLKAVVA